MESGLLYIDMRFCVFYNDCGERVQVRIENGKLYLILKKQYW